MASEGSRDPRPCAATHFVQRRAHDRQGVTPVVGKLASQLIVSPPVAPLAIEATT
jgi:hypothetical protein